jgi:HEAT repeat protein
MGNVINRLRVCLLIVTSIELVLCMFSISCSRTPKSWSEIQHPDEIPPDTEMALLYEELGKEHFLQLYSLDELIAKYGEDELHQALLVITQDDYWFKRLRAAELLFRMRDDPESRLRYIFDALRSENEMERLIAEKFLNTIQTDEDREFAWIIQGYVYSPDPFTRAAAVDTLGKFADYPEILDMIIDAAGDESPEVRKAVSISIVRAVQEFAYLAYEPSSQNVLLRLLHDEDLEVRISASNALVWIAPSSEIIADLIEAASDPESDMRLRISTIDALSWLAEPDEILPLLMDTLNDPDDIICGTAIDALGQIGAPAAGALPKLREYAETDNPQLNLPAREAIWQIEQDFADGE